MNRTEKVGKVLYETDYPHLKDWNKRPKDAAKRRYLKLAKAAIEAMNQWQDISTAPKDGADILAFISGASIPSVVYWRNCAKNPRWWLTDKTFAEMDMIDPFEPKYWQPIIPPEETDKQLECEGEGK